MPKKKAEREAEPMPDRAGTTYPSAPKDPAERHEHFIQRNARIAGVDPEVYAEAVAEQGGRARAHGDRDLKDRK